MDDYIPMSEIDKCGDIHKIAKKIKSENESAKVLYTTTRATFLDEIKTDIEWYKESNNPPVSQETLVEAYDEILRVEEKVNIAKSMIGKLELLRRENPECRTMETKYILVDVENKENSIATIIDSEKGMGFEYKPFTKKINAIFTNEFSYEEKVLAELENGKEIEFMSNDTHVNIWNELDKIFAEDRVKFNDGAQKYMKYCDENKITQSYLRKFEHSENIPNIMEYYNEELENQDVLECYSANEIENILKSKERLVYIDDGSEEFVLKYSDLADCIVDVNLRYGFKDLKIMDYNTVETIATTYGYFLNKCDPKVREDIIDRLQELQLGEKEIKSYKIIPEEVLEQVEDKMRENKEHSRDGR